LISSDRNITHNNVNLSNTRDIRKFRVFFSIFRLFMTGRKYAKKNNRALAFLGFMSKQAPISKIEQRTSLLFIALIVGAIALSSLLLATQYWFVWPAIIAGLLVAIGYFTA
jgi:hypothetical protein